MRLVLVEVRVVRRRRTRVRVTAPLRPTLHACGDDVPGHTDVWHTGEAVSRHGLRRDEADAAAAAANEEGTRQARISVAERAPASCHRC